MTLSLDEYVDVTPVDVYAENEKEVVQRLAKLGIKRRKRPQRPQLPEDLSACTENEIKQLLGWFSAWLDFVSRVLARARVRASTASHQKKAVAAQLRAKMRGSETKKTAEIAAHPIWLKYDQMEAQAEAEVVLAEAEFSAQQQHYFAISRTITLTTSELDRVRRDDNAGRRPYKKVRGIDDEAPQV
jgi:hypothetical protein